MRDRMRKLLQHEAKVDQDFAFLRDCGKALADIRDNNLYVNEASTFEAYCDKRGYASDFVAFCLGLHEESKNG